MNFFGLIIGALLAIIVVFALINWKAFLRLLGVAEAKANSVANSAEDMARVDLLNNSIEKEKDKLRKANDSRVAQMQRVNTAQRITDQLLKDVADLQKRLEIATKGTDQTRQLQLAKDLITSKNDLSNAQKELGSQTSIYEDFKKQCELSEQKIKDSEKKAGRLVQQLELSKASAEMAEMTAPTIGNDFSEIDKHSEEIQKKIDSHKARGVVARERNAGAIALDEENRQIENQEALALLEQMKTETKTKQGMDELFPAVKDQA